MSDSNQVIIEPDTIETNITKSLEAPKLDPIYLSIANDHLAGKKVDELATIYGVSEDLVTSVIAKKEVEQYITGVLLSRGYAHRAKRLSLIDKVIDGKIQEAEETGVFSKRDLLDWMKFMSEEEKNMRPKEKQGPQVAIQVNNYEKLMGDLLSD